MLAVVDYGMGNLRSVVGASLGGLVARYAAAPSDDPAKPRRLKIARLFSISSPQSGATLATTLGFTQYHRDMRPGSPFMQALANHDAEATYQLYPYVRLHDEIVGEQYAAPPDREPLWLPNPPLTLSHAGAMADERILADIGLRLSERILKAPLIDTEQLLAFAHLFVVVNKDVADEARNVGGDRDQRRRADAAKQRRHARA